jgi:hypothetical protein
VKKSTNAIAFDRSDLVLNHNNINDIDPSLDGMILLHDVARKGEPPKRLHWGYGNLREELKRASKISSIAAMQFVYFSYKAGATVRQYNDAMKDLPIGA